jgi:hypothetical protein
MIPSLILSILLSAHSPIIQSPAPAQTKTDPNAPATIIYPGGDIPTPAELLVQLPLAKAFRISATLPNGDNVFVYDTVHNVTDTEDSGGNHPHLAIERAGKIIFDLDALSANSKANSDADTDTTDDHSDPVAVTLRAIAFSQLADNQVVIAIAVSLGADQAGGIFAFVSESAGQYKRAGTANAPLSQFRFKVNFSNEFEIWFADVHLSAASTKNCLWCPTSYKHTIYTWRDGQAHPLKTISDKNLYHPEAFVNAPFISMK